MEPSSKSRTSPVIPEASSGVDGGDVKRVVETRKKYDRSVAPAVGYRKYKVTVSYDGTDFTGWQTQQSNGTASKKKSNHQNLSTAPTSADSIQARIERRLSNVFCRAQVGVAIAGSGRTDAGVHAAAQVFHFEAPKVVQITTKKGKKQNKKQNKSENTEGEGDDEEKKKEVKGECGGSSSLSSSSPSTQQQQQPGESEEIAVDADSILRFLQFGIPQSIQVLEVEPIGQEFHARESCTKKRYQYSVCEGAASPFQSRYCHSIGPGKRLDLALMQEAASCLLGRHNFSSFGVIEPNDPRNPVKNMQVLTVTRESLPSLGSVVGGCASDHSTSSMVRITAECDRFLWHMMRMISGTLIEVGLGKITPAEVKMLLEAEGRKALHHTNVRAATAPAQGLCLMKVFYD